MPGIPQKRPNRSKTAECKEKTLHPAHYREQTFALLNPQLSFSDIGKS
tara:strand:+ start:131 stop:274 length:144 start_codon:yes stop_codon:yes gene_type:complete